jgi:hypothetical protein
MMQVLTRNWHAARILRAVAGLAAVVFGFVKQDSVLGLAGGMLLLMGLADVGCGPAGCGVPPQKNTSSVAESTDITFTEIKK